MWPAAQMAAMTVLGGMSCNWRFSAKFSAKGVHARMRVPRNARTDINFAAGHGRAARGVRQSAANGHPEVSMKAPLATSPWQRWAAKSLIAFHRRNRTARRTQKLILSRRTALMHI